MTTERSIDALHIEIRSAVSDLAAALEAGFRSGATLTRFGLFETYRSPERQDDLHRKGATKARAWQSAHQYGLAADFVPLLGGRDGAWDWSNFHDYQYLAAKAKFFGLDTPISWDRVHVQAPIFLTMRSRLRGAPLICD